MKTLIRFASVLEALPVIDSVDPGFDHSVATRRSAFAGSGSLSAFARV